MLIDEHLSNTVHANAITALAVNINQEDGTTHTIEVLNQAQFAAHCGLVAGLQVAALRNGHLEQLVRFVDVYVAHPDLPSRMTRPTHRKSLIEYETPITDCMTVHLGAPDGIPVALHYIATE
jgi:hypothetical protein